MKTDVDKKGLLNILAAVIEESTSVRPSTALRVYARSQSQSNNSSARLNFELSSAVTIAYGFVSHLN